MSVLAARTDSVSYFLSVLSVLTPNLQATLPDLVAAYRKARLVVDAGHGPKPDMAKP